MTTKRLTKKELETAKQLYLQYHTVTEVSKKTNISRTTLTHHIKKDGGWEHERNLSRAELLDKATSSRKTDFVEMTSSTITVLKRALTSLAQRDDAPTVQEAKGAAAILETLDKITRLDDGNPTDIIHQEKPVTVVELRKRLSKDPFAGELEDAEFKEID